MIYEREIQEGQRVWKLVLVCILALLLGIVSGPFVFGAVKASCEVTVTWSPMSYPRFCANAKAPSNDWYRSVTMIVSHTGIERRITYELNGTVLDINSAYANTHVLRWPAGTGAHDIKFWITGADGTFFYGNRRILVVKCSPRVKRKR